ncbi:MAG TPA: diacylglycerol kinase family protein [Clostridiaceae bacterium]|nr:diacylglycerol kinase family protein [Clostridiaceae bacterium]
MKNKSIGTSFKNAFRGLLAAFASERNMKIHGMAAVLVILMGIVLRIDNSGWLALFFAIGLVFVCELFNTAIEILTDMITDQYSEKAKKVKDISAGAVMLGAAVSVIIGAMVFLGPIIGLIKK